MKKWQVVVIIVVVLLSGCSIFQEQAPATEPAEIAPTQTWALKTNTPHPTPTSVATLPNIPAQTSTEKSIAATFTPNPYYTPTPERKTEPLDGYNPFTGLIVNDVNLNRRPVMVKISNYPRDIRPQSGWSLADLMFEYYLGEGMNRFLAVFYGENPEWAGPIRSGRLVDAQLGMMYESILVYGGADERVDLILKNPDILGNRAIDTRYTEICPPLCGEDTHSLEGVFVDTAAMSSYAVQQGIDQGEKFTSLFRMAFALDAPESDAAGLDIWLITSNVCKSRWIYDEQDGNYLRWEESDDFEESMVPSIDAVVDERQLAYENIVVLFSDYIVYDRMLHDIAVVYEDSSLPAMMWRDGQSYTGYWSAQENSPIQLWDSVGDPYLYKPGRTWYIFVTEETVVEETEDGRWIISFFSP